MWRVLQYAIEVRRDYIPLMLFCAGIGLEQNNTVNTCWSLVSNSTCDGFYFHNSFAQKIFIIIILLPENGFHRSKTLDVVGTQDYIYSEESASLAK